jgi:hypothetical protein
MTIYYIYFEIIDLLSVTFKDPPNQEISAIDIDIFLMFTVISSTP